MNDSGQDKERHEERAEALLVAGSALLMLIVLALLLTLGLLARQERLDRPSAPPAGKVGSPNDGALGYRLFVQHNLAVDRRR